MMIVTKKTGESVEIGAIPGILMKVLDVQSNTIRLGFTAAQRFSIERTHSRASKMDQSGESSQEPGYAMDHSHERH
jgi:sRNA-binding carbon storage regulator CsrA